MRKIREQTVLSALKYSIAFVPLTFLGFFLDVSITSFSARITGQFFNAVLSAENGLAQTLLGAMFVTLLAAVFALPLLTLLGNAVTFYFGLKHEYHILDTCYRKTFERMMDFSSGEMVQRLFRDPYQLRTLVAITPAQMLAEIFALLYLATLMANLSPALSWVCVGCAVLGVMCPLMFRQKLALLDEAKKGFQDCTARMELEMVKNRSFFVNYGVADFLPMQQEGEYREYDLLRLRRGVRIDAVSALLPECFLLLGTLAFLLFGCSLAQAGRMGAGDLVAFFSYLTIAGGIVKQLYNQGRQMAQLPQSIDRIAVLIYHVERTRGIPAEKWETIRAQGLKAFYHEGDSAISYSDFVIKRNELVEIRG